MKSNIELVLKSSKEVIEAVDFTCSHFHIMCVQALQIQGNLRRIQRISLEFQRVSEAVQGALEMCEEVISGGGFSSVLGGFKSFLGSV